MPSTCSGENFVAVACAAAAAAAESKRRCPRQAGHTAALQVEGTIQAPEDGAYEYTMVLSIRNERGEEINRQLVGVGALFPGEHRSFSVVVEATEATGRARRRKH